MATQVQSPLLESPDRVLSTLEKDGSRRWLNPRLSKGRFWQARRIVAYVLIALFTLIPYIHVRGKPAIWLDILHRKFTLFGVTFLPTDTILLALLLVSGILTIFFVTALFGRVWCGWACPQTVYMEFLYRPIERLFHGRTGVGGASKNMVAGWRLILKYVTYVLVSTYLAHTFLSYFVGVENLRHWVTESPADHPIAFIVMLATTGLMLFNFGFFREQTCLIACPYGRIQSVLLDRSSLIISYDKRRGEPRGQFKRTSLPVVPSGMVASATMSSTVTSAKGDCVDCDMCVSVCPTGIDIRDGLQFECVGCAQCIDACDAVMDKLKLPRGLIRYSSQKADQGERSKLLRPRVMIYPALVLALLTILGVLLATRAPATVTVLRGLGRPFTITQANEVENVMRLKITNRSEKPMRFRVTVIDPPGVTAASTDAELSLAPGQMSLEPLRITAPPELFKAGILSATVRVTSDDGFTADYPCQLLGPAVSQRHEDHEKHDEKEHHDEH